MIQPQELRIGNFVFDSHQNTEKVFELSIFGDLHRVNELSPEAFNPIPLTEEILLKFGYIGNEPVFSEKSTIFTLRIHKIWKPFKIFLDEYYRFEIKYVHQLQNLFFSLCGEELKFEDIS